MTTQANRRAFTLVELLVVTGIMAVFFGLIVSGLRKNPLAEIRQAAQSLASVLISAQTRSLGSDKGSAILIMPSDRNSPFASQVFIGDMMPPVVGLMKVPRPPTPTATSVAGTVSLTAESQSIIDSSSIENGTLTDLSTAFRFRVFDSPSPVGAPSPWFGFQPPIDFAPTNATATLSMRTGSGQSRLNTVWPQHDLPVRFEATRLPTVSSRVLRMPSSAVIDLRYSGIGDNFSAQTVVASGQARWGTFWFMNSPPASVDPVGFVFAHNGDLTAVTQRPGITPNEPVSPIYLFVTAAADIDDLSVHTPRALANEYASWVVIDPKNGRVHVSPNVPQNFTFVNIAAPQATSPPFQVTNWTQAANPSQVFSFYDVLRAARAKARAMLPIGK